MPSTIAHHTLMDAQRVPEQHSAFPSQFLLVYMLNVAFCGTDHPLGSSSHPPWLCFLVASWAPARWQSMGTQKASDRVSTTEQKMKHQCVINMILLLNPKHSNVPTKKKINSM